MPGLHVRFLSNLPPSYFLGAKIRVSKVHGTENATEHGEAALHCSLESAGGSASLFSVTWYWAREPSGSKMLVHLQHDGLLEYGEERLRGRLHCHRASPADFVLQLRRVEMEDAGEYWCRAAEWQLHGTPSKWVSRASDESRRMVLTVLPSGNGGSPRRGSRAGALCLPSSPLPLSYGWVLLQAENSSSLPKHNDVVSPLGSNVFGQAQST